MEGKVRIRFLLPSTCETCQIFDSHCSKTTGRQKEPLFWTGTGRGRCIYPQRPLLLFNASADSILSSCFAQTTTLVAVLPPIIQHHIPQTTGVPAVPAD